MMVRDEALKSLQGELKPEPPSQAFRLIPGPGFADVAAGREAINDLHRLLLGREKPRLYLVPGKALGVGIGQPPVELLPMPLWDRDLAWIGGNALPDLLEQVEALLNGQAEYLFEQSLRSHGRDLRNRDLSGKLGAAPIPRSCEPSSGAAPSSAANA